MTNNEPTTSIPTDPTELEAWKAKFTQELMEHPHDDWSSVPVHPGGADAPWQN